jgi:hypothetical protein
MWWKLSIAQSKRNPWEGYINSPDENAAQDENNPMSPNIGPLEQAKDAKSISNVYPATKTPLQLAEEEELQDNTMIVPEVKLEKARTNKTPLGEDEELQRPIGLMNGLSPETMKNAGYGERKDPKIEYLNNGSTTNWAKAGYF